MKLDFVKYFLGIVKFREKGQKKATDWLLSLDMSKTELLSYIGCFWSKQVARRVGGSRYRDRYWNRTSAC